MIFIMRVGEDWRGLAWVAGACIVNTNWDSQGGGVMAIVKDLENQRLVDTETKEYLTMLTADRENFTSYYTIHAANGDGILGTEVRGLGISEKNDGIATLVRFELLKAWIPTGRAERPTLFFGDHPLIQKLEEFLSVQSDYGGTKNPQPRFEFKDVRPAEGTRTAS
jgi:hypothetical protein